MTNTLLLLDVDGPLNPYGAKPHLRPAGYDTFRFPVAGSYPHKPLRVWLRRDIGAHLLTLAADHHFDLVWATSWQDEANQFIGPAIGLPTLPVIPLPDRDHPDWYRTTWKWGAVAEYAAGRPLAWVDDEFDESGNHQRGQQFAAGRTTSTHLCQVNPRIGLTDADFASLARFGDHCWEAAA